MQATEAMVDKARKLAAHLLEADVGDIVVDTDSGHGRRRRRARRVRSTGARSPRPRPRRPTASSITPTARSGSPRSSTSTRARRRSRSAPTSPSSRSTATPARSRLLRHIAVDDCGTVLNPVLVEGQQHGGVAAGVSQTLYEAVHYDDDGNPLTSNFVDYAIPSAAEFPMFEVASTETPTPLNPLGAKGIGEASTIGSTPAVQNAVIDALAHLGVRHIDLPCTERGGVAGDHALPRRARCPTRGASRRRSSPCSRRARGRRGRAQRRRRHLTAISSRRTA